MKSKKWDVDSIPDQSGKIAIVTGGSSGIGKEAARAIAEKNGEVIIAVRNSKKGEKAAEEIRTRFPSAEIRIMELDLADLASVRRFSEAFSQSYDKLDVLINNAGVMVPPYGKTKDGFELQFGTNHLSHFALTGLLLKSLLKAKNARIVNVSSSAHFMGNLNFADLAWEKRKYKPWLAYGDSKIANLYFTYELERLFRKSNADIHTTAAHPGWAATELQRNRPWMSFLNTYMAQTPAMGALPTLRAAFEKDITGGEFFGPSGFLGMWGFPDKISSKKSSYDENIARELWLVSERLTGVRYSL